MGCPVCGWQFHVCILSSETLRLCVYMAGDEVLQAEELPLQRPRVRGLAGGREKRCEDPPVTGPEWEPLRTLG